MNKQPEITDATRNNIIDVFCEYYRTKPIEAISVKDIMKRAGYSRATFYNYFRDVYDVLEYIENDFISSFLQVVRRNLEEGRLDENFLSSFIDLVRSKRRFIDVFMNSSNNTRFIERLKESTIPELLIVFKAEANSKARYALNFYISGLIPLIGEWLRNDDEMTVEELGALVQTILNKGVLKLII